jgi:hypothetical protein
MFPIYLSKKSEISPEKKTLVSMLRLQGLSNAFKTTDLHKRFSSALGLCQKNRQKCPCKYVGERNSNNHCNFVCSAKRFVFGENHEILYRGYKLLNWTYLGVRFLRVLLYPKVNPKPQTVMK